MTKSDLERIPQFIFSVNGTHYSLGRSGIAVVGKSIVLDCYYNFREAIKSGDNLKVTEYFRSTHLRAKMLASDEAKVEGQMCHLKNEVPDTELSEVLNSSELQDQIDSLKSIIKEYELQELCK